VIYYANPTVGTTQFMDDGTLGCIDTPHQGNLLSPAWDVIADNGCFSDRWDADRWWRWLQRHPPVRFAVCPDVVDLDGDETHDPTVDLWNEWAPRIRQAGHVPAFVLHQGATLDTIPDAEVLFIGGSTEWKLSAAVWDIVTAVHHDRWVHMGRVNSWRRLETAAAMGCRSVDGTFLTFGPDVNLPRLLGWLKRWEANPMLWGHHPLKRS